MAAEKGAPQLQAGPPAVSVSAAQSHSRPALGSFSIVQGHRGRKNKREVETRTSKKKEEV